MLSILGICTSSEERERRQRSIQIDREIELASQRNRQECKLLLLGSGESGKSTIVKQMKIIHQKGYSKDELRAWRSIVHKNLVDSAKDLVTSARKLNTEFSDPRNEEIVQDYVLPIEIPPDEGLPADLITAIQTIWQDDSTPEILQQGSSQFYIMDSASYFLNHAKRVSQPDYIPTVDDVLQARLKTTGITETWFLMGKLNVHMFDVGGQRSERKKWIHCFESVTSIIFCVALSEYDQVLQEESKQNRMMESLVLFESVVNSRWFLRTSVILFLNKIDLFVSKINRVPLERYFPDYTGGNDPSKGAKYLLWRFNQTNRMNLKIYPHLTQATSTSNVSIHFSAIAETILKNSLQDSGIM
ncbi:guanine nucleotide binding protein, alpha subunit [Zychaea mexicana]|uniref:guanine nucleotide binding protein, alpha subunit n=1 Tax=Zychaea mexicana TaxID=64656 RepID=UPI0022FE4E5C|nr:guanine nucleotide binding protein, alpha subunit [Zychaea mexicana]KAI9498876.1 guanine nucleotide binding protein, alpha subunit [Zychaea mexicana]